MNRSTRILILALIAGLLLAAGCQYDGPPPRQLDYSAPRVEVIVDGLLAPIGMALLPNGGLLVAESGTGGNDDSAGVSLITPGGEVGRLLSGLPSTLDSGDLAGAPLVALAPDGERIYIGNFNQQHLWTLPLAQAQELPAQPLTTAALTPTMRPLNQVMVINPYDMAFAPDGRPVVTDATGDGVATRNPDDTTRFIHRFARYPDPTADNPKITLSPVPTGIARIGDEYYVTLTGGCPFPPGGGKLVAIDENRNERLVRDHLNMPIDIAQGPDGALWLLEFATFAPDASCFTNQGYQARTGRLSRVLADGSLDPILVELNFPGAVLPLPDGSLYVTEVYPGRVLHIRFGDQPSPYSRSRSSAVARPASAPAAIADADQALRQTIAALGLTPNPGASQRAEPSPLTTLGQMLFFDPILSGDHNISCATCHHPALAGADGRVLPIGAGGRGLGPERVHGDSVRLGPEASSVRRLAGLTDPASGATIAANPFAGQFVPRNSPTILNAALYPGQFWDSRVELGADGAVHTLEQEVTALRLTDPLAAQALFPLVSGHEMAGATLGDLPAMDIRRALVARLRGLPAYVDLFTAAFGDAEITLPRLAEAIAAFERRFIFTDAPWDRYLAGEDAALSAQQKRGALLFFGQIDPAVNCAACHRGDIFSDFQHHNLLAPQLGPSPGHDYTGREDWGRGRVTFDLRHRYQFRTPSLRNVEITPPYFHDGAFPTLAAAIRHHSDIRGSAASYDPTANAIPAAHFSSLRPFQPAKQLATAAPLLIEGLPLREGEIADLVAFLTALTDSAARDLSPFLPDSVPSGLPLDPLPDPDLLARYRASALDLAAASRDLTPAPADGEGEMAEGLTFRAVAAEVGLDFQHAAFRTGLFEDPAAAMGGGLCWLDFDNDGWLDLYWVNAYAEEEAAYWQARGGLPRNVLYRNVAGQFQDVSAGSGADLALRGQGCLAADFNNDGWTDLFITADGPNALLWNRGDGSFTEGAAAAGLAAPEWNSAAAAADLNGDGWLDLFVAAYIDLNKKVPKPAGLFPQDYYGLPDRLYLAQPPQQPGGTPVYREVAAAAGLAREERSLGALFSDLDGDGDLDLYIANDGHPNRLYAYELWPGGIAADAEGLGFRFHDLTDVADVGDTGSGMGVAGGDWDGDGQIDLLITNWERELNALYRNQSQEAGHLAFEYSTFRIGLMGLGNNQTGWGVQFADLDLDSDLDMLIVNGRVPITNLATDAQGVRFYRNRTWNAAGGLGRPGQFLDLTRQVGLEEVGPLLARGSALADFDNDGDLDLAVNVIGGPAALLRNEVTGGNWLLVALDAARPGLRGELLLPDGRTLVRELYAGSSYLATEEARLHFGLGPFTAATRLTLRWPDGRRQVIEGVAANQILRVSPP